MISPCRIAAVVFIGLYMISFQAAAQSASVDAQLEAVLSELETKIAEREAEVQAMEATSAVEGSEQAAQESLRASIANLTELRGKQSEQLQKIEAVQNEIAGKIITFQTDWKDLSSSVAPTEPPSPFIVPDGALDQPSVSAQPSTPIAGTKTAVENDPTVMELPTSPLEQEGLSRRVLSLPGARLVRNPLDTGSQAMPLPTFSVLYVYGEQEFGGETWIAVGRTIRKSNGWLKAVETEEWRSMLVMQYAPKGNRGRVLFFKSQEPILDIIDNTFFGEARVKEIYQGIKVRDYDPELVIAIEPQLAVDSDARPYLMPILDFKKGIFDTGEGTQILELAAINIVSDSNASDDLEGDVLPDIDIDQASSLGTTKNFRTGIAFVIDTTLSMGPYIDTARDFAREVRISLEESGIEDKFDFALVGFRDNTAPDAKIGYVTQVFRDFGEGDSRVELFAQLDQMKTSVVSTKNWREDAFAGVEDAITNLDWSKQNARFIFLVTDASPRTVGDNLARDVRLGPQSISALAQQNNIALFTFHMQTPQARKVSLRTDNEDDTKRGVLLYSEVRGSGVGGLNPYFELTANTEREFNTALTSTARDLVQFLSLSARGKAIPDLGDKGGVVLDAEIQALSEGSGGVKIDTPERAELISKAVVSELFRYQQEYLGALRGTEAPRFYRAWAADKDLLNPAQRVLDVSVLMTREQLADLAKKLNSVIEELENKERGLGDFFVATQELSGRAAIDPSIGTFLPAYLDSLPYASTFTKLTAEQLDSLGQSGQQELLSEVKQKTAFYRRINASEEGWFQVLDRVGSEQLFPMPLTQLP